MTHAKTKKTTSDHSKFPLLSLEVNTTLYDVYMYFLDHRNRSGWGLQPSVLAHFAHEDCLYETDTEVHQSASLQEGWLHWD